MPDRACDIHMHFILRTRTKDPIIKLHKKLQELVILCNTELCKGMTVNAQKNIKRCGRLS
jgi:hypothetical protein